MMDQLLWRRKAAVDQKPMELHLKPKLILRNEVDHRQPKQKKRLSHLTMSSHQLQREGEVGLRAPKRRHLLKSRLAAERAGDAGGRAKKRLQKKTPLPPRKNKTKKMRVLTSKVFQFTKLHTQS